MKNTIKDLTLILLYLTAWEERTPFDETFKCSWKGYDFDVLNELTDEELIFGSKRAKSVSFSEEGEQKALELLRAYGLND
jgi:hypothetical protein